MYAVEEIGCEERLFAAIFRLHSGVQSDLRLQEGRPVTHRVGEQSGNHQDPPAPLGSG